MNHDRIAGICRQFMGSVKVHWGTLTNNPRLIIAGTSDQRAGRIQERYANSQEKAARQLEEFLERNRNWHSLNH